VRSPTVWPVQSRTRTPYLAPYQPALTCGYRSLDNCFAASRVRAVSLRLPAGIASLVVTETNHPEAHQSRSPDFTLSISDRAHVAMGVNNGASPASFSAPADRNHGSALRVTLPNSALGGMVADKRMVKSLGWSYGRCPREGVAQISSPSSQIIVAYFLFRRKILHLGCQPQANLLK
jgi:hypothetical protein